MKVENNSVSSLSSQGTDPTQRVDHKTAMNETSLVQSQYDHADVSDKGRLLAKARASMDSADEVDNKKLDTLRQAVQNGNYTVQIRDVAKTLVNRLAPGS